MYNNAYTPVLVGKLTCRVVMLISTLDLPARAIVLNQKQFNGHSSCCWWKLKEGAHPIWQWCPTFHIQVSSLSNTLGIQSWQIQMMPPKIKLGELCMHYTLLVSCCVTLSVLGEWDKGPYCSWIT